MDRVFQLVVWFMWLQMNYDRGKVIATSSVDLVAGVIKTVEQLRELVKLHEKPLIIDSLLFLIKYKMESSLNLLISDTENPFIPS